MYAYEAPTSLVSAVPASCCGETASCRCSIAVPASVSRFYGTVTGYLRYGTTIIRVLVRFRYFFDTDSVQLRYSYGTVAVQQYCKQLR